MGIPEWLSYYFGLPSVTASELRSIGVDVGSVPGTTKFFPLLSVLPMGWSWSVYFCQCCHENVLIRAGVARPDRELMDFTVTPSLKGGEPVWMGYVDNSIIGGTDSARVERMRQLCDAEFEKAGLVVHEVTGPSRHLESLGITVDTDCVVKPSAKRVWKYYQALTGVLAGRHMNSKDLSVVMGHLTFVWCIDRCFLGIGRACFDFISQGFKQRRRLWPAVLRELRWARDTLFFVQSPLRRPWSRDVQAIDASPWGAGVVAKQFDVDDVEFHGRYRERWRYKWEAHVKPRGRAFEVLVTPPGPGDLSSGELQGWSPNVEVPNCYQ